MQRDDVVAAFRAESRRLAAVMSSLSEEDMDRATPCAPWTR